MQGQGSRTSHSSTRRLRWRSFCQYQRATWEGHGKLRMLRCPGNPDFGHRTTVQGCCDRAVARALGLLISGLSALCARVAWHILAKQHSGRWASAQVLQYAEEAYAQSSATRAGSSANGDWHSRSLHCARRSRRSRRHGRSSSTSWERSQWRFSMGHQSCNPRR